MKGEWMLEAEADLSSDFDLSVHEAWRDPKRSIDQTWLKYVLINFNIKSAYMKLKLLNYIMMCWSLFNRNFPHYIFNPHTNCVYNFKNKKIYDFL